MGGKRDKKNVKKTSMRVGNSADSKVLEIWIAYIICISEMLDFGDDIWMTWMIWNIHMTDMTLIFLADSQTLRYVNYNCFKSATFMNTIFAGIIIRKELVFICILNNHSLLVLITKTTIRLSFSCEYLNPF